MKRREQYSEDTVLATLEMIRTGTAVREAAKYMGIPEGTVASWISRHTNGVKALRCKRKPLA